jgi:hypothetical protein
MYFIKGTSNRVSRLPARFNTKNVHIVAKKVYRLRPMKDALDLKVPGIYCILCECGKVYEGQTGCSIETRFKEHAQHTCLYQPGKSVVAKHSIKEGHHINFKDTTKLVKTVGCMYHTVKEAIKIWLPPNNFNRDTEFTLSQSQNPTINIFQQSRASKQQWKALEFWSVMLWIKLENIIISHLHTTK